MKVLVLGASGMVGQGVLRECLAAPDVTQVTVLGRAELAQSHPKLRQVVAPDLMDLQAVASALQGFDACFFCLGVSSAGMKEATYRRLTYDLTLSVARLLAPLNPGMVFTYVSGKGTDSAGRSMWSRVKGRTEDDLCQLPFASVGLFRPNVIQPLRGIRSRTAIYQWFYTLTRPVLPLLQALWPQRIVTTEDMGQAMLQVARQRTPGRVVLEAADIARLGRSA